MDGLQFTMNGLHGLARKERVECTALLLDNVDVKSKRSKGPGATPAIIACQFGRLQVLQLLIDHNAAPNKAMMQVGLQHISRLMSDM